MLLTSDRETVTRACLRERIKSLFASPADVALLYFSGHGTENDLGGYLVTTDADAYDEGVWLTEVLVARMAHRHVAEIVIIVDSCHSGSLGSVPAADNTHASLREGLSILTASRASQVSMEEGEAGVFTTLVCAALEGGAADVLGHVTVAGVYAYVDPALGAWDQRPLFKSHVARMLSLRRAHPAIDVDVLRHFPEWFSAPDAELPLSPRHERTADPHDAEAEAVFRSLPALQPRELRRARRRGGHVLRGGRTAPHAGSPRSGASTGRSRTTAGSSRARRRRSRRPAPRTLRRRSRS